MTMKYALGTAVVFLAMLACLTGATDIRTLVVQRCQGCHDLAKNCDVDSSDRAWWKGMVERMVSYQPELLTPMEVDAVSRYLAQESRRKELCQE